MDSQLKTRLLENNRVERMSVVRAALRSADHGRIVFDATAVSSLKKDAWSGDADMGNFAAEARQGQESGVTVQIDFLTDTLFRMRFAQGEGVPENQTPMLVGTFAGAELFEVEKQADRVTVRTAAIAAVFCLDPFRIEVFDLAGRMLCGIGGPEKNQFCQWDAVNTAICRTLDGQTAIAAECFDLRPNECIYGLGETFHGLNKVGQTLDLINKDGLGVTSPRTYKNIPFYISSHGYGAYFNHHTLMSFWVGSQSGADVQVALEDDFLDCFLMFGNIKQILTQYTDITGKGCMPPAWSFGFWQSKFTYHSAEETLDIARKLRENDVPCDVLHLDTDWFAKDWHCDLEFDPVDFPDPAAYFREMTDMGFHVSLWHMPYIREPSRLFSELAAVDGFVRNADGGIMEFEACGEGGGRVGVIDFSNPRAVAIYRKYIRCLLELGASCMKTDFGEGVPINGKYCNGLDGVHNRNLYALLYNRTAFEVTEEVLGPGQGMVWARSAWAGCQRYPVHWGGDVAPNWHNMGPQLAGGLSFGLSGGQFWSHDTGGFLGETLDLELLVRWYQFGMFNSHSRTHGLGDREIYKLPKSAFELCRDSIRLRYRLLPYIIGQAYECIRDSLPMLRAMAVDFQEDPTCWNLSDQYMFGSGLLAAPLFNPENCRLVYLPSGTWTDWFTGETVQGGRWIDMADIPLERFPLFIKEGAVIGMQPVMDYIGQRTVTEITLRIAPFTEDGITETVLYVNGQYVPVSYSCRDGRHSVKADIPGVDLHIDAGGTECILV